MSQYSLKLCSVKIPAKNALSRDNLMNIQVFPRALCLLIARNGISLILMRRLFSLNTSDFVGRDKFRTFLLERILSIKKNSILHLPIILHELVSNLIDGFKRLYDNDEVQLPDTLHQVLNPVLETFLRRCDIALIDQFAILNTLLRNGFCFCHDSKYWEVSLGKHLDLKFGRTKVLFKLNSNFIFQKLRLIMKQLEQNANQHDLLCLMYTTGLREFSKSYFPIQRLKFQFQLTIDKDWRFWVSYLSWNTTRTKYLSICIDEFVSNNDFFSKKDMKYWSKNDRVKTSKSFHDFFVQIPTMALIFKEILDNLSF